MPRITPSPSIWLLAKGLLCARIAILVLLGTLLFVGPAHAAAPAVEPAGETSSSAPAAEPAAEASPAAPAAEPAAEASPPASTAEPAPEASSPVAPVVEAVQEVLSPVEVVVASPPETSSPVSVDEPPPEASSPVEQVKEAEEVPAASKETKEVTAAEPTKEATEVPAGKPDSEQAAESLTSSLSAASQGAVAADSPPDAAQVSSAPAVSLPTIFPGASGEISTISATGSTYAAAQAQTIAARRAEDFNRELGGLGASLMDTYTADGLDGPSLISAAIVNGLVSGTAARTGAPAGGGSGGSGGSGGGSRPIGPPPGPAPSGTFGGAAGGGSGTGLSAFPTFAGHLLLGAPLAMRRLRLSFQPWLTAFFVLIPERPG